MALAHVGGALLWALLHLGLDSTYAQATSPAKPGATACLREAIKTRFNETRHTSQDTADGAMETIFNCIGTTDKQYVELGTQSGQECNTRYFRERLGWKGLMIDGGFSNENINLRREMMYQENIVELLKKYQAPFPIWDMLSVDIDLNTYWLLLAILRAGYRPRLIITEVNNNFIPGEAFVTVYLPKLEWDGTCYFGGSTEAFVRMGRFFGYSPVHLVPAGHNLIMVRNDALDEPLGWDLANISTPYDYLSIHRPCANTMWYHVPQGVNYLAPDIKRFLHPVILVHPSVQPSAPLAETYGWRERETWEWYMKIYNSPPFDLRIESTTSRRALVQPLTDARFGARGCAVDLVQNTCERVGGGGMVGGGMMGGGMMGGNTP